MAILYVFTVNDPNNAGPFPPSVASSSWFASLNDYNTKHALSISQTNTTLLFADETALNTYLSAHRCTDAGLLADIASWKSAHGVSYTNQYFTLTSAGISPDPIIG